MAVLNSLDTSVKRFSTGWADSGLARTLEACMARQPLTGDRGPLLAVRDVSKSFGAVEALRGVHLELYAGEAHGLVGENGAGKSTLVKILAGAHAPDAGTLTLAEEPLVLTGPADARAAGIAVIHQEPTLFPGLSVADQQLVEIAKALSFDARVLVMDEPSAALSGVEVERLFAVARSLCDR